MKIIKQLTNAKQMINSVQSDDLSIELSDEYLKQIQDSLLEMYLDILKVCDENRIPVFLGGGSALGAIRHHGFIPWDDDLDLNMPRTAYKKFVNVFEEKFSDKYILNAPDYSENSITRFPKILKKDSYYETVISPEDKDLCKLFIDLFLIEFVPDNPIVRYLKGIRVNALEFISGTVDVYENKRPEFRELYLRSGKLNYYIRIAIGKFFSFKKSSGWHRSIDKAVQYHKKTRYVCFPTGRKHYFGEILEYDRLFPMQRVEFAGHKAPVFKDCDYYLSNLYGNYMDIPPVEKRERHFVKEIRL